MFRLVPLFALVSCAFAGTLPDDLDGRIVNGEDTTIQRHPYQISLQKITGSHICGGSIISEDIVVTAAHCMQNVRASDLRVRLGSTEYNKGGELVAVKAFRNHEGYDANTHANDVCVIKLATPVRESRDVRYIRLADIDPKTGTEAVVTGWGTKCFFTCNSIPTTLQQVSVDIVDEKTCASDQFKYGPVIKPSMLCAYAIKKDACQGDSGGPLVAEDRLVGIVSWGYGCALKGYPGVYCSIAHVRSWIVDAIRHL